MHFKKALLLFFEDHRWSHLGNESHNNKDILYIHFGEWQTGKWIKVHTFNDGVLRVEFMAPKESGHTTTSLIFSGHISDPKCFDKIKVELDKL